MVYKRVIDEKQRRVTSFMTEHPSGISAPVRCEADKAGPYVSCKQAVEILGVSAKVVARYLDTGDIPCERCGQDQPRVRLSDVLAYKETRAARVSELTRMREEAADGGLYDLDLSDQMFAYFEVVQR